MLTFTCKCMLRVLYVILIKQFISISTVHVQYMYMYSVYPVSHVAGQHDTQNWLKL